MSLEQEDLTGEFNTYGKSKLIFSKGKFFNFHFPLPLSSLLGLQDGDHAQVFVNMARKIVVLKIIKEEAKEEPKARKK